jgi:hypothetical protein
VTYQGILVCGAEIQGEVNLEWANISFPIQARWCVFKEALILRNSHIVFLHLENSSVQVVYAQGAKIQTIRLRESEVEECVDLTAATIEGDLDCIGSRFASTGEYPVLNACLAKIKGSVYLGGSKPRVE